MIGLKKVDVVKNTDGIHVQLGGGYSIDITDPEMIKYLDPPSLEAQIKEAEELLIASVRDKCNIPSLLACVDVLKQLRDKQGDPKLNEGTYQYVKGDHLAPHDIERIKHVCWVASDGERSNCEFKKWLVGNTTFVDTDDNEWEIDSGVGDHWEVPERLDAEGIESAKRVTWVYNNGCSDVEFKEWAEDDLSQFLDMQDGIWTVAPPLQEGQDAYWRATS